MKCHNDVTIFTHKLTQEHCSFLLQVHSAYQSLPQSSLKYMKERLHNLEGDIDILS